jgi:hypothetical protein
MHNEPENYSLFIKASFRLTVPRPLTEESSVWQSERTPTLRHFSSFHGCMFSTAQPEMKSFQPINRKLVSVFSHLHSNAPLAQVHSTSPKPAPMRWRRTICFDYVNNKETHSLGPRGRAMVQQYVTVSHHGLLRSIPVRSMWWKKSGSRTGFPPSTSTFPCQ